MWVVPLHGRSNSNPSQTEVKLFRSTPASGYYRPSQIALFTIPNQNHAQIATFLLDGSIFRVHFQVLAQWTGFLKSDRTFWWNHGGGSEPLPHSSSGGISFRSLELSPQCWIFLVADDGLGMSSLKCFKAELVDRSTVNISIRRFWVMSA